MYNKLSILLLITICNSYLYGQEFKNIDGEIVKYNSARNKILLISGPGFCSGCFRTIGAVLNAVPVDVNMVTAVLSLQIRDSIFINDWLVKYKNYFPYASSYLYVTISESKYENSIDSVLANVVDPVLLVYDKTSVSFFSYSDIVDNPQIVEKALRTYVKGKVLKGEVQRK